MNNRNTPPKTTVLILNVPDDYLIGINIQFFHSNQALKGIKLIPDGIHVIHWGKDQNNIRTGKYFQGNHGSVIIFKWNEESETMEIDAEIGELNVSKELSRIGDYYNHMIPYPMETEDQWSKIMSSDMTIDDVYRIIPKGIASSVSTSKTENEALRKSLYQSAQRRCERTDQDIKQDEIINSLVQDQSEKGNELNFTEIDLKRTWSSDMTGSEITDNYLDKSWYLNQVILKTTTIKQLFTELQICFTLVLIFANYSGAEQWKRICELMLRCRHDVTVNPQRYIQVLELLSHQMELCPVEYFEDLFQRSFVTNMFFQCKQMIQELPDDDEYFALRSNVASLGATLISRFGIDITEFNQEDDEEEEPVIVDLPDP